MTADTVGRLALAAARMGAWEWNVDTDHLTWTEQLSAIHGLPPGVSPRDFNAFLALVHADDRERLAAEVGRALRDGGEFHTEFRVVHPDGSTHWIAGDGLAEHDAGGRPIRMVGIGSDITDRKSAETDRIQLLERERAARADAEVARDRLAFLARASSLLGETLDQRAILSRLARLVVPAIADWCAVDIVADDGSMRRLGVAHVDRDREPLLLEVNRRYPPADYPMTPRSQALMTGRPVLLPEIDDARLAELAADRPHLELLRRIGLRSGLWVPLVRRGRSLGVLSLGLAGSDRRFGPDEEALVSDLGSRVALALDNAQLYERAQAALHARDVSIAERDAAITTSSIVNRIARAAAGEDDLQRILEVALAELRDLIAFTGGSIALVEDDALVIRAAAGPFAEQAHGIRIARGRGRSWRVVQTGRSFLANDLRTDRRAQPTARGIRAYLAVPLVWRGRAFGLLEVDSTEPDVFHQSDIDLLEAVGTILAGHIEAARRRLAEVAALERVETERSRLRTVFEAAPAVIALLRGPDLVYEFVNARARAILGGVDVTGKRVEDVVRPEGAHYVAQLHDVYASGEPIIASETLATTRAGEQRFFDYVFQPTRDAAGDVDGILVHAVDVTEQVLARQARIAQAEELSRFKTTLDAALDCVFMFDPESLRFFYVNQGAMDQVGYSRDELLTMTPLDVKPEFTEASFQALIAPLLSGEMPSRTFTTLHRHKDGTDIPVEVLLQYIAPPGEHGRFVAVVRDITERIEARARLQRLAQGERNRAAELQAMIQAIGDAVIVCGRDGRVTLSNPAARAIFSESLTTVDEILERLEDPEGRAPAIGRRERQGPTELRLAGNEERWIEIAAYPVLAPLSTLREGGGDNDVSATILVIRDVTKARQTRVARDAYMGVLSHELRTPITSIYLGSKTLSKRSGEADPNREIVADVEAEAERLYRLVEDLIVLARYGDDGPATEIGTEPLLLQRILPNIARLEEVRWPGHRLVVEVEESLPTVVADTTYVEQVTRNLLTNAAKYSPLGATVRLAARPVGDEVHVTVLDEGPGFPAGEEGRLFDLFYRSPGTSGKVSGAGIGLWVCRRLVEAMGGRIWARPRPEGGAEFGFALRGFDERS